MCALMCFASGCVGKEGGVHAGVHACVCVCAWVCACMCVCACMLCVLLCVYACVAIHISSLFFHNSSTTTGWQTGMTFGSLKASRSYRPFTLSATLYGSTPATRESLTQATAARSSWRFPGYNRLMPLSLDSCVVGFFFDLVEPCSCCVCVVCALMVKVEAG